MYKNNEYRDKFVDIDSDYDNDDDNNNDINKFCEHNNFQYYDKYVFFSSLVAMFYWFLIVLGILVTTKTYDYKCYISNVILICIFHNFFSVFWFMLPPKNKKIFVKKVSLSI